MNQSTIFDIVFTAPALPVGVPFQRGSRTSRKAAERLASTAMGKREQVLALFRSGERLTADEAAHRLNWKSTWSRPRVCECSKWGLLRDTGEERPSDDGSPMAVYRYATAAELADAKCNAERLAQYGDDGQRKEAALWARVIVKEMEAA